MDSKLTYKFISKGYDALDVLYFKNERESPRQAVYDFIGNQPLRILDICTGTAANSIKIAEGNPGAEIIGIDLSESMLKIAENKIRDMQLKNISLRVMDATKMDFADESFDVALISLVLHELDEVLAKQILQEAYRVLKPNGKLIVVEWEEPEKGMKRLKFLPIKLAEPKGFTKFLKSDMEAYFLRSGFKLEDIKHCDYSKVLLLRKSE